MTMTAIDTRLFRSVAGKFPTGVTVITTADADGNVHAMTANGFASISLEPPIIMVSIGDHARTLQHLMLNDNYAVNILGHEQKAIAKHFSGKPEGDGPAWDWVDGHPFVPGVIGRIGTRIVDRYRVGDHVLFFGEVTHLDYRDGELPLIFSSGQLFSPLERVVG